MDRFGKLILRLPAGQEEEFVLEKPEVVLGRGTTSDITLADAKVSRAHARLECRSDGCTLVDLGSGNGIHVNGTRVERTLLVPGDVISLGDTTLRFESAHFELVPEILAIDSEAELDATLAQASVPMTLSNTEIPRLVIHTANRTWDVPLIQDSLSIGRHPSNDLVLNQARASRGHARLERKGDAFLLRDLDSTNGTWMGDRRIAQHLLCNGETFRIGDARLVFKSGFALDDLTLVEGQRPGQISQARQTHPPVVFVPGMMGSQLWQGSQRIWPNPKLMLTQPELYFVRENDGVEARDIVGEVVFVPNLIKQQRYGRMGDYLEEALGYERGKDLLEFAYDFRQDNRISARRLAQAIDNWAVTGPITLIAHSLGTIVSRYYMERQTTRRADYFSVHLPDSAGSTSGRGPIRPAHRPVCRSGLAARRTAALPARCPRLSPGTRSNFERAHHLHLWLWAEDVRGRASPALAKRCVAEGRF